MEYRNMRTEEILRIGDVDRTESVHAEFVTGGDGSGFGLVAKRIEHDSPEEIPTWGDSGTRSRIAKWRPLLDRGGHLHGAFDGDRLVGFVILGPRLRDGSAEIVALFVDRDHRREGIGQALMAWAFDKARAMEVDALFLYSNPTESAVEFYLRCGFEIVGLISKQIVRGLPGDIVMAMRLDEE